MLPLPPDQIASVLRQFFAGLAVPSTQADATGVDKPFMKQQPVPSIGAAAPQSNLPQPMGGPMGALMAAGPIAESGMRAFRDHPIASAAEATGVPSIMRGARDQDLGSIVRGAVQAAPFVGGVAKGVGALAPAVAEEATPMLTADQLGQWRGIESFLNSRNAANAVNRVAQGSRDAMRLAPRMTPVEMAAVRPGADAEMMRNLLESGFAGGKTGAMVELPTAGAGRAGSTATAMAAARKVVSPDQLRGLVRDEIARRGGATSPEVEMAATEEVARRIASGWKPQGLMQTYP